MKYKLAPSILAADFMRLGEQIGIVEANGAEYIHYDVMDGMFVPSISFGMPVLKSVREGTSPLVLHEGDPALEAPAEQKQLKSAE